MTKQNTNQVKGSSLMAVIIITVASITVIGAMTILVGIVSTSVYGWQDSLNALFVAESLTDDMMLRIVRNPSVSPSSNELMTLNGASAFASLLHAQTTNQPNILVIRGKAGNYTRSIQVLYIIENGKPKILSRREIY